MLKITTKQSINPVNQVTEVNAILNNAFIRSNNTYPTSYDLCKKVVNMQGFTEQEYTALTGRKLPYNGGDFELRVINDRVHAFTESGNISRNLGAATYVSPKLTTHAVMVIGNVIVE